MSDGARFRDEYLYAREHEDVPCCRTFMQLARMYAVYRDWVTLALVTEAARDVRAAMTTPAASAATTGSTPPAASSGDGNESKGEGETVG